MSEVVTPSQNLLEIKGFLEKEAKWVVRTAKKEAESGEPTEMNLAAFLAKKLEATVNQNDEAYAEALKARTFDQKHEEILKIIENRKKALEDTTEDEEAMSAAADTFDDDVELERAEAEGGIDGIVPKSPRKKGWLEKTFDAKCEEYVAASLSQQTALQDEILGLVSQLEVNRRVRFFYDLQKLRIGAGNRSDTYAREFGIKDGFIDYAVSQLERLETHSEKMVDRILLRSPDGEFYAYLRDTYLGVGVMMAGCMISEISAPERFHSVSSLWKYCGLAVIGNDPETGVGGHAQARTKGEKAAWNHFLRTKLLGVMAGCMIKAQTRYIGTPDERERAQNVRVLNDYKMRLVTKNELIPAPQRVYNAKGKEIFQYRSNKQIEVFTADKKPLGTMPASSIPRRSKAHINKMATRYMVKMFLVEILNKWRNLKGFESLPTYDEAKLRGGVPHKGLNLNRIVVPNKPTGQPPVKPNRSPEART